MPARPHQKIAKLALAVAGGSTVSAWCRANDVPIRTAYEWTKDDKFKVKVNEFRSQMFDRAIGRMARLLNKAIRTWDELLDAGPETTTPKRDAIRRAVVRDLISSIVDLRTHAELAARLDAMEAAMAPTPAPEPAKRKRGGS